MCGTDAIGFSTPCLGLQRHILPMTCIAHETAVTTLQLRILEISYEGVAVATHVLLR